MRQLGPGDEIGGYLIEALAGRGGMGLVYRARQRRPDRIVAIKVIAPELAADADFRTRFEQESTTAAQIEHPNVIPVYEVGEEDGLLFLVMRFVQGVDLGGVLREHGKLAPDRTANLVSQVAAALDAAHANGLVHRDVKPGNVLVAAGDHVYLTDFGLTKRVSDASGMTKTGMLVGTLDYIAPEQIEGRAIDARADVYALGCVTYQMLSGSVPFPRPSEIAKIFAHVNDPAPVLEDVPAPLADAVERAMAKQPADRFPSAGDFGRAVLAGASGRVDAGSERSVATGEAASGVAPTAYGSGAATAGRTTTAADRGAAGATAAADATAMAGAPAGGGGRAPAPGSRPSGRTWAFVAGAVALVAAIGVAFALASGSGTPSTHASTTHTGKSTPTTTTTAPTPTSVRIYSPVNASGGLAATVTQRGNGSCFTNSIAIERPDAWRCMVGNTLYDPCFDVNQTQVLCPIQGPWTNNGLLITVHGLPSSSGVKSQGTSGLPWAIELADGAECLPLTGATNLIAGQRLGYDCTGGVGLYGNIQRSGSVWMMYTGMPHSVQLTLQPIGIAWY